VPPGTSHYGYCSWCIGQSGVWHHSVRCAAGQSDAPDQTVRLWQHLLLFLDFTWSSQCLLLRCCFPQCLDPSNFSILWTININTSKHISPQVILIIKHQNLLSQMAWGPFSLQSPLFGDWWQHNQSKQILQTFDWKYAIYLLGCMIAPTMWYYGLKPPPNSIIHLLPILDQSAKTTWRIKILIWWCLIQFSWLWSLQLLPLWHQPPKRKTLNVM
jgi:hypothetical protein